MNSKTDRDGAIDDMLRATLRADAARATVSDECIDAETIAAWSDGALPAASAARIETHLSRCSHCQALLAALVRSAPPTTAPSRSIWQRWQLRWVVPIAAAASALALWIAIPSDRREAAPQIAALEDSRQQPATSSPAPPSNEPAPLREEAARNLEKRSAQRQFRDTTEDKPASPAADSAAAAAAPVRRDRAAEPQSLQETVTLSREAPAAPPLRGATPDQASQRQELAALEARSADPAIRWRVVNRTRIERSTDAGVSWQAVAFPEATDLVAIRALSTTSAFVTTADNRQFRTDDAGKTWTPVAP